MEGIKILKPTNPYILVGAIAGDYNNKDYIWHNFPKIEVNFRE